MPICRFVIGNRGGEQGVFISPPGVDAETAPAAQLTLSLTTKVSQLLMKGVALAPWPKIVATPSFNVPPIILLTAIATYDSGAPGYIRPWTGTMKATVSGSSAFAIDNVPLTSWPAPSSVGYNIFGGVGL
jgi:hypothetical protein